MPFPAAFLDNLAARTDIVDLVGGYVTLTRRGGDYWGCCPFHHEKTPSFHVVPDRQMFYCFGCKKGGDAITFIREIENLPYADAVKFLAKRAGLEVPEDGQSLGESRRRARLLQLNRDAALFYHRLLKSAPEGQAVRDYLQRRQILWKTAVRFGMGASPNSWDALLNAMTGRGYQKSELLEAGLIVKNRKGGFYDKFRNRLMLPVVDIRGDVVAFGSRVLDKSEPKYMNSPDTPVYSKRRVLYGMNLAKSTKRENFLLCEGNLDVVTLHQAGVDNAVASMGTALTGEQAQLVNRFRKKELVFCYDNDNAGEIASQRALEILRTAGFTIRVLQLPRRLENGQYVKQDPDDFIKYEGVGAFERLLNNSERAADYRMSQIAAKYDLKTDEGRLRYSQEVGAFIVSLDNAVERDIYTYRAAEAAGVPKNVMEELVQRAAKADYARQRKQELRIELNPATRGVQPQNRDLRYDNVRSAQAEAGLIRLLLMDDSLFPEPFPLTPQDFSSPVLQKAFFTLWDAKRDGFPLSFALLSGTLTPEEMSVVTAECSKPESAEQAARALSDYIRIIREESDKRTPDAQEDVLTKATMKYKKQKNKGGTRT
ncbi:MAG: DNA primase [Oscillospiraceae bacterium]|nr:DNA primase [Oscillospiraceae bacterium]